MHQNHREFGRRERLTQYAIDLFDLVDITPAVAAGKHIDHRFLQSDISLAAARHRRAGAKREKTFPAEYQNFIPTGLGA